MPPKDPRGPSIRQSKEALLEAAQAAIADQRNRPRGLRPPPEVGPGRQVFRAILLLLIIGGAGLLVMRPVWLTGPALPKDTPSIQAASATLSLIDAISKVEAYQALRGKLPARLSEVGVPHSGIRYNVVSDSTFEVSLATSDTLIRLRSTDSLKPRIVDAIRILQGRT